MHGAPPLAYVSGSREEFSMARQSVLGLSGLHKGARGVAVYNESRVHK